MKKRFGIKIIEGKKVFVRAGTLSILNAMFNLHCKSPEELVAAINSLSRAYKSRKKYELISIEEAKAIWANS